MNLQLIQELLAVAVIASVISTAVIQKIKIDLDIKSKKAMFFIPFFTNVFIGGGFAMHFTNANVVNALWVGLFSFVGADALYKTFLENKMFDSIGKIEEKEKEKEDDKQPERINY